jgi:hypothetical protein
MSPQVFTSVSAGAAGAERCFLRYGPCHVLLARNASVPDAAFGNARLCALLRDPIAHLAVEDIRRVVGIRDLRELGPHGLGAADLREHDVVEHGHALAVHFLVLVLDQRLFRDLLGLLLRVAVERAGGLRELDVLLAQHRGHTRDLSVERVLPRFAVGLVH